MSNARSLSTLLLALASGIVVIGSIAVRNDNPARTRVSASPAQPSAAAAKANATSSSALLPATVSSADAGVSPDCAIPDHGWGDYEPWKKMAIGRLLIPQKHPQGQFDLLLHFHGGGAIRKLLAPMNSGLVIAAVDAGQGSRSYTEAFYGSESLETLIANAEALLAPARLRHLIVSAWSAGYGAVRELLKFQPNASAAVILLDAVHAGYRDDGAGMQEADLAPFVMLAEQARANETHVVLTHSEIQPPSYASTSEVANYIIAKLDGQRRYAGLDAAYGVQLKTAFRAGDFQLRGYTGASKEAHCAHLKMLPDILERDILPAIKR